MRTLAAMGECTSYLELIAATGLEKRLLSSNVQDLRVRKLVERVNPDAARNAPALYRITERGRAYLLGSRPSPGPKSVPETTVQRALRVRPPLATVWGRCEG